MPEAHRQRDRAVLETKRAQPMHCRQGAKRSPWQTFRQEQRIEERTSVRRSWRLPMRNWPAAMPMARAAPPSGRRRSCRPASGRTTRKPVPRRHSPPSECLEELDHGIGGGKTTRELATRGQTPGASIRGCARAKRAERRGGSPGEDIACDPDHGPRGQPASRLDSVTRIALDPAAASQNPLRIMFADSPTQ